MTTAHEVESLLRPDTVSSDIHHHVLATWLRHGTKPMAPVDGASIMLTSEISGVEQLAERIADRLTPRLVIGTSRMGKTRLHEIAAFRAQQLRDCE